MAIYTAYLRGTRLFPKGIPFFRTIPSILLLLALTGTASAGVFLPVIDMDFISGGYSDIGASDDAPPAPLSRLNNSIAASLHAFRYDKESGTWSAYNYRQRTGIATTGTGGITLAHANGSVTMQLSGAGRDGSFRPAVLHRTEVNGRQFENFYPGFTEWYRNENRFIEQGLDITDRPTGSANLNIAFDISGDLSPALTGQALVFSDRFGPLLRYSGLKAWDATGRNLEAAMSLSGNRLVWEIDDDSAVYPVSIDPVITEWKILTASDQANGDAFGYSVSISNNTAIIGARQADSGGTDRGQAYIFAKDQGGTDNWGEVTILTASDQADSDAFGQSVAISGDTAIVGAHLANSGGTDRGQAYIFAKDQGGAGNWGEVKVLSASDKADNDHFGYSVAISGDTAIIGAHYADPSGDNSGKAYIFAKDQGGANNWGERAILTASDGAGGDNFGWSVGISGDTAIVGAIWADSGGIDRGQAYIFAKDQGGANNWGEVTVLSASDKANNDYFSYSVAISGDTAIAGACYANSGGSDRGQAYIFAKDQGSPDNWGEVTVLSASDKTNNDYFGQSVAISGDYVASGADYWKDLSSDTVGQVYIFAKDHGGTNNWGQLAMINASDKEDDAYFGHSVSLSGEKVIVGADEANSGGTNRGQGYIFILPTTVTGINPSSGTNAALVDIIALFGTNFVTTGTTTVKLNRTGFPDIDGSSVTVVSSTSITCTFDLTGKTTGIYNVVVTNPNGLEGVLANGFTVTVPTQYIEPVPDGGHDFPSSVSMATTPVHTGGTPGTVEINVGGDSAVLKATVTGIGVNEIIVTGMPVSGSSLNDMPLAPGIVYQYIDILPARFDTIEDATLYFTVQCNWMDTSHCSAPDMTMYHFTNNQWEPEDTQLLSVENGQASFRTTTQGFSLFAITGRSNQTLIAEENSWHPRTFGEMAAESSSGYQPATQVPIAMQTTVAPPAAPAPEPGLPLIWIAALAGIVVLGLSAVYARRGYQRRQNPALFRKYD